MRPIRSAFTLIELLIVVSILGVMAMIVVPHFVGASNSSRGAALADQLRIIREQSNLYRAQHQGKWPGVDSNGTISPEVDFLITQLTAYTDDKGNISTAKSATFRYGPYLPSVPANPISGLKTISINTGSATPTPDDSTGWIFQPATGRVWSNSTSQDASGKAHFAY